ncbi:glycosyltransferase family 9 protein [Parvibaculaceae bacterium PLY_AMNH_Bact1]|nr:glycosyltransferase family 9 protein [Parvibaculaceae bacterium PLY_AMNH_Bact1]
MGSTKNILIIKHGAFGDVMQSEGALHDIRGHHPDDQITVLTEPAYAKIMERCPWIDNVVRDPRAPRWRLDKMWTLRRTLKAFNIHRVYDLQNSSRTADYFKWIFADVEWSGTAPGCSHPHKAKDPKSIHSLRRIQGQLTDAGLTCQHTLRPDVSWMANEVGPLLTNAGLSPGYILLVPGSSASLPHKRWPFYGELAARLIEDGHQVVTVPGPDEMELCAKIPGTTLTGGSFLDWFDLAGVVKAAAYIIGNDTGPSHLAAHMGKPGLALFGSHTTVEKTGIKTDRFDAIEVTNLNDLSMEQVYEVVTAHLKNHSNSV